MRVGAGHAVALVKTPPVKVSTRRHRQTACVSVELGSVRVHPVGVSSSVLVPPVGVAGAVSRSPSLQMSSFSVVTSGANV